jgi:DNA-binding protein H-NS
MDITKLNLTELTALRDQISDQIKLLNEKQILDAKKQIQEIAASAGISLRDLIEIKSFKKTSGPVAAKYRDPANADNVWSGRGRQPRWLSAYVAEGKNIADFLI